MRILTHAQHLPQVVPWTFLQFLALSLTSACLTQQPSHRGHCCCCMRVAKATALTSNRLRLAPLADRTILSIRNNRSPQISALVLP